MTPTQTTKLQEAISLLKEHFNAAAIIVEVPVEPKKNKPPSTSYQAAWTHNPATSYTLFGIGQKIVLKQIAP